MKVPPGHLALVRRADALPPELRACAVKLSRYDGPISVGARRLRQRGNLDEALELAWT